MSTPALLEISRLPSEGLIAPPTRRPLILLTCGFASTLLHAFGVVVSCLVRPLTLTLSLEKALAGSASPRGHSPYGIFGWLQAILACMDCSIDPHRYLYMLELLIPARRLGER